MYEFGVEGRRGRGRPNRVWMDGVRKILRGAGNSRTSDSYNCALGCVGTCRSKDDRWWLALCSCVSCDLNGVVSGTVLRSGCGAHLGQVFLNLGSGNYKLHDEISRQGSGIKYAEWFNSEMKEVILDMTVCRGLGLILTTLTCRCWASPKWLEIETFCFDSYLCVLLCVSGYVCN